MYFSMTLIFVYSLIKMKYKDFSTLVLSLGQSLHGATSVYQEQSTSGDHLTILNLMLSAFQGCQFWICNLQLVLVLEITRIFRILQTSLMLKAIQKIEKLMMMMMNFIHQENLKTVQSASRLKKTQ